LESLFCRCWFDCAGGGKNNDIIADTLGNGVGCLVMQYYGGFDTSKSPFTLRGKPEYGKLPDNTPRWGWKKASKPLSRVALAAKGLFVIAGGWACQKADLKRHKCNCKIWSEGKKDEEEEGGEKKWKWRWFQQVECVREWEKHLSSSCAEGEGARNVSRQWCWCWANVDSLVNLRKKTSGREKGGYYSFEQCESREKGEEEAARPLSFERRRKKTISCDCKWGKRREEKAVQANAVRSGSTGRGLLVAVLRAILLS
jgi:hypothetical protein